MSFNKSDAVGVGSSIVVHLLLLGVFALLTASQPQTEQLGYMEVDFGPFAEGQPVQEFEEEGPDRPQPEAEDPEEAESEETPNPEDEATPATTAPEDTRPVELPEPEEDIFDDELIQDSDAEEIAPEMPTERDEEVQPEPESEAATEATTGGAEEGDTGERTGDDGDGDEQEHTSPFNIEGLDRDLLAGPTPEYSENINATIRIQITVDPQGRIVSRVPLVKGPPSLERAVMNALSQWRFNALPSGAPQENQRGVVTFNFRLE